MLSLLCLSLARLLLSSLLGEECLFFRKGLDDRCLWCGAVVSAGEVGEEEEGTLETNVGRGLLVGSEDVSWLGGFVLKELFASDREEEKEEGEEEAEEEEEEEGDNKEEVEGEEEEEEEEEEEDFTSSLTCCVVRPDSGPIIETKAEEEEDVEE